MKYLVLSVSLLIGLTACGQNKSNTQTLEAQVDQMLEQDQYVEALQLLDGQTESAEVLQLKEKTHLNYGLFLEYRDSQVTDMKEKMNAALRQYVKVLEINKNNEKAISEIEQILGIYATFGDRKPADDVLADLRKMGWNV
ncbi:MAG TPA: hypothetical protein DEQ34_09300 [Balneolaceae bacterium]|nr:hypothetical protein [Balneolaceae bacterium]|tara:strand:+ start:8409 stop:8828 length:420 start_codon:yes stop_codon:yes gene_type:complete